MKVVAFNGSPRKNGNTSRLINHVFNQLLFKPKQYGLAGAKCKAV